MSKSYFSIKGGLTPEDLDAAVKRSAEKMKSRKVHTQKTLRPTEAISGTFTVRFEPVYWKWEPMPLSKLWFFVCIGMMSYSQYLELLYPQARQFKAN